METTGPKVPSRYLTGPAGSCHDNCKCETKPITETKPKNPSPKRIPKPPADRSHLHAPNLVPKINKPPSVIPKSTTRNFKNNNVVKDQTLKKDVINEPKKRDIKLKSVSSQAKTYNRSSSRTPTRRLSDICVPNKDTSIPSSNFSKRRLSEIVMRPNTDSASVSKGSTGRVAGINKNESRKDSKLPLVNKRSNSLKSSSSTSKTNARVSPLRSYRSMPKLELKGSKKSKPVKPIEELEHEETLHIVETDNDADITKSQGQSQKSADQNDPLNSEEKPMKDDQNEVVESSEPLIEDGNLAKDGQPSISEVKDDQNVVVESSPPSLYDQNEVVTSSPPPLKDNQNEEIESSTPLLDDQNAVKESSPPSLDDQNAVEEASPPSLDDHNEVVEASPPSMADETVAKDGPQDNNVSDSEVVETNDCSLDDPRFRRGTILRPESENKSLIELQFKKGKELENETEEGENISLRRLSSDGVVCIPESQTISVDLKHQEMEEKKDAVKVNNVIEETASKLIQTRKSKVKALVGAFETIVSSEPEISYTSRSRSFGSKKV